MSILQNEISAFSRLGRIFVKVMAATVVAILCYALLGGGSAQAETITVDNTVDPGNGTCLAGCTLREAIAAANANSEADTIKFAPGVTGTITLNGNELEITDDVAGSSYDVTIEGPGAKRLTISGNGLSRVFMMRSGAKVKLRKLKIAGGNEPLLYSEGGGIKSLDFLTLESMEVTGNRADLGAGIYARGVLLMRNSTVSANAADLDGGGVYTSATTSITNSTISGNSADVEGGGVFLKSVNSGLYNTTITRNTAPAGRGSGVVRDSTSETYDNTRLEANIISGNTNSDVALLPGAPPFKSEGYNVIGGGNGTSTFTATRDIRGVTAPKLGALAYNGGQTKTHKLLSGSPAINRIPPSACLFDFDQRGFRRPIGPRCDTGSLEQDYIKPTITNMRPTPGSFTRDRTPTIRATVKDNFTNLSKSNIKLYVDGTRKTAFSYNPGTDRLSYTIGRLANRRHTVKIVATDAARNTSARAWAFTVDTVKPSVSRLSPRPGASLRDRTPTIRATVKDNLTNLRKANIRVFVDGRRKTAFRYSVSRDRLTYTSGRLAYGWHRVRIVVRDRAGNTSVKTWRFKLVR